MKKEYVKPYLAVESFQLDASVAGVCPSDLNHSLSDCSFVQASKAGMSLDIYYGPACVRDGGIDMLQHQQIPENADICYHGPAGTYSLHGS